MKLLLVLARVAAASADVFYGGHPYGHFPYAFGHGYHHYPYAAGVFHHGAVGHQYHAQDSLGQYEYAYAGGPSAKHEIKTFDGVTKGEYSYVDGHGLVQKAAYVSDPLNGFRVAATNLPVGPAGHVAVADTPEVAHAKAIHFQAHNEALLKLRKRRSPQVIAAAAHPGHVSTVQSNGPFYADHHFANHYAYSHPYSYPHHYGYY